MSNIVLLSFKIYSLSYNIHTCLPMIASNGGGVCDGQLCVLWENSNELTHQFQSNWKLLAWTGSFEGVNLISQNCILVFRHESYFVRSVDIV